MDDQSLPEATGVPRLTGDELFEWSRLINDVEHAQKALDRFGRLALARRGLRPDMVRLTNEGYITNRRYLAEAGSAHSQERINGEGEP